jgi:hypothetical protein
VKKGATETRADILLRCEEGAWRLSAELQSLGAIFRSLGPGCSLDGDDLFGLGEMLNRLSLRAKGIQNRLGQIDNTGRDERGGSPCAGRDGESPPAS